MKQRLVKVDGKVRTDETYPAGFMGEISTLSSRFPLISSQTSFPSSVPASTSAFFTT